jgi:hypothetical protein
VASDAEFIGTGKSYGVGFGDQKFRLNFKSAKLMTFQSPDGRNAAEVAISVTPIANGLYMIYWSPKPGSM